MCGIAGIIDLGGRRRIEPRIIEAMAQAIYHRGPDEDGFLIEPGIALANRRLSIVGLADGRQPIYNEDGSVVVMFNGELFDFPEKRAALEAKGHVFRTHTDTEIIPHLWEEYGEQMFEHIRGQFAICLYDLKKRQIILCRDRMGICPLFWSVQPHDDGGSWLLFASEIKSLLASGMVPRTPDIRGINHVFSFFANPGPVTCFEGVNNLLPGHWIKLDLNNIRLPLQSKPYWQLDFPDQGQELDFANEKEAIDRYEELLLAAVSRRLRADVPVVSYLSGGVDSSMVVALASKVLGRPIPTFTISVQSKGLNEETEASQVAKFIGTESIVVQCGDNEVRDHYPELIRAAEFPVVDTSCTALLMLAKTVRQNGYKVALTGEGADEFLAGYPWFKIHKMLSVFGANFGASLRQFVLKFSGQPQFDPALVRTTREFVGGHNGWLDIYGLMSMSKLRFYKPELRDTLAKQSPFLELGLDRERLMRWHPFHRSLAIGVRTMLNGHLMSSKGDRLTMNSSVEGRYPFLDEDVVQFVTQLHPRWKLRGMFRDKYILRKLAERWLPKDVAWRRKLMFRAPLDSFHLTAKQGKPVPAWIEQVLSAESLRKTNIFDVEAVQHWRKAVFDKRAGSLQRTSIEMGLVAVTATQLWHHLYISGDLSELPSFRSETPSPVLSAG